MSLVSLAGEIRSYDARSLSDAVSLTQDERIHRILKGDYEIFELLRQRVPEDGLVLFVTGSSLPTVRRALCIGQILYPPRFTVVARLLPVLATPDMPVFAVDLIHEETPAPAAWKMVEERDSLRVWRYFPEAAR